jgi:hypothetical protein
MDKLFIKSKLLEKHSSSKFGRWKIYGEDDNADMGGTHIKIR